MSAPSPTRFAHSAMYTEFALYVDPIDQRAASGVTGELWSRLDQLEHRVSSWRSDSDIGQLHAMPAGKPLVVSADTFDLLQWAQRLHRHTDGAFDISVGPLLKLWRDSDAPPSEAALKAALAQVGLSGLQLDARALTATLHRPGMRLDLGGIAKGFALDVLAEILEEYGIARWLLSAGGSSLRAGGAPRGEPRGWSVGLGKTVPPGYLRNRALSASGRAFRGDHVINPATGRPVVRQVQRAWAVAAQAAYTDGLSTAAMLLSPTRLKALCQRQPPAGVRQLLQNGQRVDIGHWRLQGTADPASE